MPHLIICLCRVEGAECGGLEDQCTQTDDEDMDIEEERIPLSNNGFNGEWIINSSIEKHIYIYKFFWFL